MSHPNPMHDPENVQKEDVLNEDDAMEREHALDVEKEERAVEKDLERLQDNFGNAGYY